METIGMTYSLFGEGGQRLFASDFTLGKTIHLCKDQNFAAVITAVKFALGEKPSYLLKWRDGRSITESWMSEEEILAMEKLAEP